MQTTYTAYFSIYDSNNRLQITTTHMWIMYAHNAHIPTVRDILVGYEIM
jgi:hypothetical protein